MFETILHRYGEIHAELDAIGQALNDADALRDDVTKVFNTMADFYTGEAATALQAAHQQISQQLDQLILDMQATKNQAVEQQIQTAALDHQQAGNFA
jgi:uncharacterized protein YukE